MNNDKDYLKIKDHFHYTGRYRGADIAYAM